MVFGISEAIIAVAHAPQRWFLQIMPLTSDCTTVQALIASTECVPQNRDGFWHQAKKAPQRWFLQITMPTTNCQLIWNPMSIFFNIDAVHVIKENCPPSLTARAQCTVKMVSANHGADNKLGPLLHTATIRTSKCKENTKFLFTARANCALILWGSLPKK